MPHQAIKLIELKGREKAERMIKYGNGLEKSAKQFHCHFNSAALPEINMGKSIQNLSPKFMLMKCRFSFSFNLKSHAHSDNNLKQQQGCEITRPTAESNGSRSKCIDIKGRDTRFLLFSHKFLFFKII